LLTVTGFVLAQEIPAPPKGGVAFAEWQAVTDTASAQRLCVPMSETPKVTRSESGYVRLPVNFVGTRQERVSWDIGVKADLRKSRGVQFDFFCRDLTPFSSFSLYFRSGGGWYHAAFSPEKAGVWQRIVIDKADTRFEGKGAGWGAVDMLRLSGWRGADADTECAIANLGPAGGKPDVLVVRAESCSLKGGDEAKAYGEYAGTVSATLDRLGVASSQVADVDLSPDLLEGVKLVALPYNPSVPTQTVACLRGFVARGGKMLVCYSLPKDVAGLLGLRATNSVVAEGAAFSGFARTAYGLKTQPAFAQQGSWRTTMVAPAEGKQSRVIAVWRDSKGADTQIPAITLTASGAFIGHVWFASSAEAGTVLMRALVGELVPDVWRQTAESAFARIGLIAGASDFAAFRAELLKKGSSTATRRELAAAVKARGEAERLLKANLWSESVEASGRASASVERAWCLSRPSRKGEHRAFWCHSAFGLKDKDWDASIRLLKESGFNAILPNMLWGGLAYYPSRVLPEYGELPDKGDQISQCLAACKKYGVQCHVWKVNWNTGGKAPKVFIDRMKAEGRVQKEYGGELKEEWLCPSHPANQTLEVEAMLEIVRNYKVDGVHFDYIRYPGNDACFCEGCRARFEAVLGHAVQTWPGDTRKKAEVRAQWLDFRRSNISAVVQRVAEGARKIRPEVKISAAVFRNWPLDRDGVGQDWKLWCDNRWLDFVCPMDYIESNALFRNVVLAQKGYAGKVPLYPGIGLSCWKDPRDTVKIAEQIAIVRELDVPGFTVFNYDANAEAVLPNLRLGVTSDKRGWRIGSWLLGIFGL
jgi:uncharacterized lipoprotein YddW (UPF0748 family)